MADESVRRNVTDDISESTDVDGDGGSGDALPRYGPWVSFYGFFHRFFRRQRLVFGGLAFVGALAVARYVSALDSGTAGESILLAGLAVVGVFLSAFGVGYFVVRADTSCCKCGATFSKERVGKRFFHRKVRGEAKVFVVETLECRRCDDYATEVYAHPDQQSPRW